MERVLLGRSKTNERFQRIVLVRKTRWLIWLVLVFIGMNSAIFNGILASAGGKIKADLHMMNLEYSTFLAFYCSGRVVGAFFLASVINVVNRRYLLVFSCLLKGIAIFSFTCTTCFPLLMLCRIFTGVANAIHSGYLLLWVNQFAMPDYKALMAAFITFATPLGRSWGLMFEMFFGGPAVWRVGMRLNGISLIACSFLLMCFPNIYFSSKLIISQENKSEVLRKSEVSIVSIFNVRQSELEEREIGMISKFKLLFSNGIFLLLVVTRITLALINAAFIFGMPGFIASNYPDSPKNYRIWMYCAFIVTGPFIGSLIGGILTKKIGGYENKSAFLIVLIADLLTGVSILEFAFLTNWKFFLLSFYGYLIFASAVLPNLFGIMVTSIPAPVKAKGTAIANLMNSAFGGFLAPFVFGTVTEKYAETDKKMVMKVMAGIAFFGTICMLFATILRMLKGNEEKKEPKVPIDTPKADVLINEENPKFAINESEPPEEGKEEEFESKV